MRIDVYAEMNSAIARITPAHITELIHHRIVRMVDLRMIGVTQIKLIDDGTWGPADDGEDAYVTPVCVYPPGDDPEGPPRDWWAVPYGLTGTDADEPLSDESEMIDIVAWSPAAPDQWALRTGLADWLGACPPQLFSEEPVRVARSPLSWLKRARPKDPGICILSHDPFTRQHLLGSFNRIAAEDIDHVLELQKIAGRPLVMPGIVAGD